MFTLIATTTESALPAAGIIASLIAGIGTGITAVWGWFRTELNDCKADRTKLFARIEELHAEVEALSMRVGNVERTK